MYASKRRVDGLWVLGGILGAGGAVATEFSRIRGPTKWSARDAAPSFRNVGGRATVFSLELDRLRMPLFCSRSPGGNLLELNTNEGVPFCCRQRARRFCGIEIDGLDRSRCRRPSRMKFTPARGPSRRPGQLAAVPTRFLR